MTDRASAEELRAADWDAAFDTLTSGHVFPNDRLSAREQTVFQMTVGYIKRHMRDRLAALRSSESDGRASAEPRPDSGIDEDVLRQMVERPMTSAYFEDFNAGRLDSEQVARALAGDYAALSTPRTDD
jgi:hypothetical protein